MTEEGRRPPTHPAFTAPSEYVNHAEGDPSLLTDRERALPFFETSLALPSAFQAERHGDVN